MRLHALAVVAALLACSTRVQQDTSLAQPTVVFPQAWTQDEAGADQGEATAEEAQADTEEGEAKEEKAPAEDEATNLCCETAKAGDDGSELTGCKMIEADTAAKNACIDGGKTFKACKDAECSGDRCRCSN